MQRTAAGARWCARRLSLWAFVVLTLGVGLSAHAGNGRAAALAGRTESETGQPLAGVSIVVRGLDRSTETDEAGRYRLEKLPARDVTVIFSRDDRSPVTEKITLSAGETTTVDVTLGPAALSLSRLVTTGTAHRSDVMSTVSDVDVLAGREKQREQQSSLGASLDDLAGVSSISAGSQAGKPVIRGLSGNRVRILKDGIGFNHQQFGARHTPNMEPFFANRLEVVRGAASVLYGSDAMGGAVNVLPHPVPIAAPGELRLDGAIMSHYAGVNNERASGLRLQGARGGLGFTGAFVRREAGNLEVPNVPTFPETGEPGQPNFSGKLDHTDFEQLNYELGAGYSGQHGDVSVRVSHWENELNFLLPPPRNLPNGIGIGQNLENDSVIVKGDFDVGLLWTIKPKVAFSENLRQSNPGPGGTTRPTGSTREFLTEDMVIDVERDSYTGRLVAQHGELLGLLSGRVGLEIIHEEQTSRGPVALTPGGEIDNLALFAFEEITVGDWHLDMGLRYDDREQKVASDETFDESVIPADPRLRDQSYGVFTGSLGANYRVSDELALVANVARGFRAPTLFELHVNGVHGGVAAVQVGDPTLQEETSLSADVGLRWRSERLEVKATAYRNAVADFIFLASTGQTNAAGLPIFQTDQGDSTLFGGDLTLNARLTERLSIEGTYERVEGQFDGTDEAIPLLPADQARLEARVEQPGLGALENLYFSIGGRYANDKDAAGRREPFSQFDETPFGTASTDSYALLDLRFGFDLALGEKTTLQIDGGVDNALDKAHRNFLDTFKGYALSPGRNVWLRAHLPFELY